MRSVPLRTATASTPLTLVCVLGAGHQRWRRVGFLVLTWGGACVVTFALLCVRSWSVVRPSVAGHRYARSRQSKATAVKYRAVQQATASLRRGLARRHWRSRAYVNLLQCQLRHRRSLVRWWRLSWRPRPARLHQRRKQHSLRVLQRRRWRHLHCRRKNLLGYGVHGGCSDVPPASPESGTPHAAR